MGKNYVLMSAANGMIANPLYFFTLDEVRLAMEHDVAETVGEGWEKRVGETEAYAKSNTDGQVYSWRVFELPNRDKLSVPTPLGKLTAEVGGDSEDYPTIYTYIERSDGVQLDLVAAEVRKPEMYEELAAPKARVYLYGDTTTEEYTNTYDWSEDEINIDLENDQEVIA